MSGRSSSSPRALDSRQIRVGTTRPDTQHALRLSHACTAHTACHACRAGVLHFSITNLTIPPGKNATTVKARLNQMALFVSSLEEELLQEQQTEQGRACILDIIPDGPAEEDKDILLRFSDSTVKMDSSEALHVVKDQALSGNAYLYFANCNPPGVLVSFNIHVGAARKGRCA
jgi:hypothetical protein